MLTFLETMDDTSPGMLRLSRRTTLLLVISFVAGAAAMTAGVLVGGDGAGEEQARSKANGPVTAAERFDPDDTTVASCTTQEFDCLEQAYGNLAFEYGARKTLANLQSHVGKGGAIDSNCHRLTHAVGYGTLTRNGGDVGAAFAEGDSTCWSGYFHGVLERAFAGVPESQLAAKATSLCTSQQVRATTFLHYQCVHGLGHGLMLHTAYELPAALEVCEAFEDEWESTSCDGGVFMENVNASRGGTSKYLKDDDLIYPCNGVSDRHKLYCYLMVTSRVLQANGYDWADTARICERDAEPGWRDECFQSFGRDASGQARRQVPTVVKTCSIVADRWLAECVYGAARDMVSEDAGPMRAATFCSQVAARVSTRCAEGVGTILSTLHPDEGSRIAACRTSFTRAGLAGAIGACLRGARVVRGAA